MGKLRLNTDMMKPFSAEGDLTAWLAKVKLVTRLQKIPDLESFIPLFLEGDTLVHYLQLNEGDQKDVDRIEMH